ncbi:MAG TPA: hypothetical protein VIX59_01780 [Candidatus Binataceae bacterium]
MPLDGLRGHRELAARLFAEIRTRPSHAYLFSGPRGVGKALVAQGLAHGILCERSPGENFCCTPERCPVRASAGAAPGGRGRSAEQQSRCDCCSACVQAALGVHPDYNYVARPPNRVDVLIEQVRELIVRLGIKPSRAPIRVAIIDDAETLNLPAQNALLKTLEEPPGHALIFMVSSSERALLDTVRSRARPVRFAPLAPAAIEAILITRGTEPGRAGAIARLARGSAARALALLAGEEPPVKELLEALARAKSLDFVRAQALAQEMFANRDQARANLELIARLLEEILCYKLLRSELAAVSADTARAMSELANNLTTDAIAGCLEAALRASAAIDEMANPRLQAEQWWMTAGRTMRGEQ